MKNILSTINLSIGYRNKNAKVTIAENLNLNLVSGKLISLIGANGIGKSTLLRTITGIQKPLSGKVLLSEKDITTFKPLELAQNLSVVLTEKLPPSNLSVFELVALGRQPYTNWIGTLTPEDVTKVNEALELTQITHLSRKKHFEISDGQLQKVLIARALAQDTPLIILDEPTTHLDLLHKVSLFKLLKKLTQETQKCILFSTHDIDLAIQLSDEMIIMTPDLFVQDEPCNLISKGSFATLFKDEHIVFDAEKGKFVIT
ncbi:ABC transporter ATP-binding protein [Flavobacterium sp. Fl-318]|uniref:ABC transporter ATP-binding protein n=1 Tax=Flavobacterium cupriresistens TaxID=2893885 RepID=A0ABU4RDX0_9FLAO|nr:MULTISPECIES: ABC transporter ATP-binding protein [unclassified Flavobacterium]MDX6189879.1 ABC transporter ATP-binding protein [Flavobacterium sp. Fl-318]UFH42705.1 ABC transporter ATP-binding protein [Flavobacterium sp. F-323]